MSNERPPDLDLFLDILHASEKSNLPPIIVFEKLTVELAAWQIKGKQCSRSQG